MKKKLPIVDDACKHEDLHGYDGGVTCWECNTWFGPEEFKFLIKAVRAARGAK